jgi:SAM-dependent methyltransferase
MTGKEDLEDRIRGQVREKYARVVEGSGSGCGIPCCGEADSLEAIRSYGEALDYEKEDLLLAPGEANLGLGCGNPIGMADLQPGETVLDLGSGAGFDAFLAAGRVGGSGRVIGVDMTPEMVRKARENAEDVGMSNVEFRLGTIEALPVRDDSVDVVVSNCVVNLSPDKSAVFGEMHRCLKPGGRIVVSDILRQGVLPEALRTDPEAYTA